MSLLDEDRESVRVLEGAEAHLCGNCQCGNTYAEISYECDKNLQLACGMAQAEVLEALGRARVELERRIQIAELEERVLKLEAAQELEIDEHEAAFGHRAGR